jgi:hypothetical protein
MPLQVLSLIEGLMAKGALKFCPATETASLDRVSGQMATSYITTGGHPYTYNPLHTVQNLST